MTYAELVKKAKENGANNAEIAIAKMMDIVETETGSWPDWNEEAPEWVQEQF